MNHVLNNGELLETTSSTQTELKTKLASNPELPNFYFVQALEQSSGRGRQDRTWASEKGNLFLSVLFRGPLNHITWIPHHVGCAILKTLFQLGVKETALKIKWPNDILEVTKAPAKLAGLIVEKLGDHFIVGIGINVDAAPLVPEQNTSSLRKLGLTSVLLDEVRTILLENLKGTVNLAELKKYFEEHGFFKKGDTIQFGSDGAKENATIIALGEFGELKVQLADGEFRSLFSEDIHLRKD